MRQVLIELIVLVRSQTSPHIRQIGGWVLARQDRNREVVSPFVGVALSGSAAAEDGDQTSPNYARL